MIGQAIIDRLVAVDAKVGPGNGDAIAFSPWGWLGLLLAFGLFGGEFLVAEEIDVAGAGAAKEVKCET